MPALHRYAVASGLVFGVGFYLVMNALGIGLPIALIARALIYSRS